MRESPSILSFQTPARPRGAEPPVAALAPAGASPHLRNVWRSVTRQYSYRTEIERHIRRVTRKRRSPGPRR